MLVRASAGPLPGRSSLCHESERDERRIGRQERDGWRASMTQQAGWFPLSSCQGLLTRTFTTRITLLLQFCQGKKREEKQRRARGVCERGSGEEEEVERRGSERTDTHTHTREHKRERVRGGCLGAEGRRRTRRPAKRSGGAACELRALRIRMGQPVQSDVWTPSAEYHRQCGGQWAN